MHSDILHSTKLAFNSLKMIQNDSLSANQTGDDRPLTEYNETENKQCSSVGFRSRSLTDQSIQYSTVATKHCESDNVNEAQQQFSQDSRN